MGYGSLIMGLYDHKMLREVFEIDEKYEICVVIAIGKADTIATAPARNDLDEVLVIK